MMKDPWRSKLSSLAPISIITAYYDEPRKAHHTLEMLKHLHEERSIEVVDAAVMCRPRDSDSLRICESWDAEGHDCSGELTTAGGILGAIFPPAILELGAVGAATDTAASHFSELGFTSNLLKEIGENLPPGGAAAVAVIEEKWLAELTETLANHSGFERFVTRGDAPDGPLGPDGERKFVRRKRGSK
jgi:uncharacterized membrane protein